MVNREDIIDVLKLQYGKALGLMEKVISQYDEALWDNSEDYGDTAWQVAYHALFYTNIYLAPSEDEIIRWSGQKEGYEKLKGGKDSDREVPVLESTLSQNEILDYLNHINSHLDAYLKGFEPEKRCWPPWYDENQMEFHFNNLRHLQQHTGALIERHDRIKNLKIGWR